MLWYLFFAVVSFLGAALAMWQSSSPHTAWFMGRRYLSREGIERARREADRRAFLCTLVGFGFVAVAVWGR